MFLQAMLLHSQGNQRPLHPSQRKQGCHTREEEVLGNECNPAWLVQWREWHCIFEDSDIIVMKIIVIEDAILLTLFFPNIQINKNIIKYLPLQIFLSLLLRHQGEWKQSQLRLYGPSFRITLSALGWIHCSLMRIL